MKESKIISSIGFYGSLIMANTSDSIYLQIGWLLLSAAWIFRYFKYSAKK